MAKILYVEDNLMGRDMLPRRLKRKGFECVIAVDGGEAIEFAHSEQPDLILMDMTLPVKDGWTVAREIKAAEDTKNIPIIALIHPGKLNDKERALTAGCDDYEVLPIELPCLLEKIERLLSD
jgi:two-component system cell cycle response regulator DivK